MTKRKPKPIDLTALVPVLQARLTCGSHDWPLDLQTEHTYIKEITGNNLGIKAQGMLNGQPYIAWYAVRDGIPYASVTLPQQGVEFYECIPPKDEPLRAIRYKNQAQEKRSQERTQKLREVCVIVERDRYSLEGDADARPEDFSRLGEILGYLGPTLLTYYVLLSGSAARMIDSKGQGSMESIFAPKSR